VSFRRDRETDLAWRQWVRTHEGELIAIGIPREVWADRLTWWRFVDHGYHPPIEDAREVRFRVEDLSEERQRRLYEFLDAVLPEARYSYTLWAILHSRFGVPAENGD
jgi:hypothetical protein